MVSEHVTADGLEEFKGAAPALTKARSTDVHFKTPNIQLYSNEAEERDSLLKNVGYTLLLKLSDNLDDGYCGSITIRFDLTEMRQGKKLFVDF